MISEWFSYNRGVEALESKGLYDEIQSIADGTTALKDGESKRLASQFGWTTEKRIDGNYEWAYDAYKDGVALEFERGAQTKARWSWMKFELGRGEPTGLERFGPAPAVEVGVLLVTREAGGASVERCERELDSGVFDDILSLEVPIAVAEFDDG